MTGVTRRLVLWDVDGTLITTGVVGRRALERGAADAAGLDAVPGISMGGKTDPQIVAEILAAAGVPGETIPQLVPKALASAEHHLAQWRGWMTREGRVHPGVREVLERLRATGGVRQTLLTGNVETNAFVKVDTFGLAGFFDFAVGAYGSDDIDRERLVPVALGRAERIRGERYADGEVWIVGDTGNDLRCARAGGARCLLVETGREGVGPLGGLTPDAIFPDLSDTDAVLAALLGA